MLAEIYVTLQQDKPKKFWSPQIKKVMERNYDYYLRGPYIRKNLSYNSNDVSRKKKFIADKVSIEKQKGERMLFSWDEMTRLE